MRAFSTPLLAAVVAAAVSPALAAPAPKAAAPRAAAAPMSPAVSDVRCLLSMTVLTQDKQRQQAAQVGVYYFAGRLSARPGVDLASLVKAEAAKLGPSDLQPELTRCGGMISASSQAVQSALNALRPPGAPPPAAPGASAPAPAVRPPAPAPAPPIIITPK